jgi:hypothetical protein
MAHTQPRAFLRLLDIRLFFLFTVITFALEKNIENYANTHIIRLCHQKAVA